jgi:ankyrin repeat protein
MGNCDDGGEVKMKTGQWNWLAPLAAVFAFLIGPTPSFSQGKPADQLINRFIGAAAAGDTAKVKDLLAQGVDPNAYSTGYKNGTTAMMEAAQYGRRKVVGVLLDSGVDLKSPSTLAALSVAISKGHFRTASALLKRGVDSSVALVGLSGAANLQGLKFLFDKKVPVDVENFNGATPLMSAAGSGQTEAVKLLLAYGADVNYQNKKFQLHGTDVCRVSKGEIRNRPGARGEWGGCESSGWT